MVSNIDLCADESLTIGYIQFVKLQWSILYGKLMKPFIGQ